MAEMEKGSSLGRDALLRLRKNKPAIVGAVFLVILIVIALLTPWIAPYEYQSQNLLLGASPPSADHWLGTDVLGRDQLTRIMYSSRVSVMVGFVATSVALIIGVL